MDIISKGITWIIEQKEWLFSGLGIVIISIIFRHFLKTKKQSGQHTIRASNGGKIRGKQIKQSGKGEDSIEANGQNSEVNVEDIKQQ